MSRWLETNYIQSQQTIPLFTEGRLKGVVLGWIISLSVEPGIEPATFRFQSKVLVTPLPSLRSSSTFLLLSLSLALLFTLSVLLPSFLFHFLSCFLPRKSRPKEKNESVFIYVTLPIIHSGRGPPLFFSFNGLKVDY